jgi:transposase
MGRRIFPDELKADAIRLVVEQRYSFAQASKAMGVGDTALRRWVAQWRAQKAVPPRTVDQISADAQRIRELEVRVADLERELEILKKSTAFFVKEMDRSSSSCAPSWAWRAAAITPLHARADSA